MGVFGLDFCDLGTKHRYWAIRTGAQLYCLFYMLLSVFSCSFGVEFSKVLHLLLLNANQTCVNGCFPVCWPSFRMLLLVTGSHLVSGYLTLRRHRSIVNRVSAGTGPRAASVLFQSPAGGQNSSAWSLFLHLPRILAQLALNFDEVAFCRYGCLFFQATCRRVWQCLDLDLWMFLFHKSISSYWWLSWKVGRCSECDVYFTG